VEQITQVLDFTNVMLYLQFMACPRCASNHLAIKNLSVFERIMVFLTGKRRYRCWSCDFGFRAPERRKSSPQERNAYKQTQVL
jgi:transposase-like protein